jgi:hypothetical protein
MIKKAVVGSLPALFFLLLSGTAGAQYVFPTPTPTPKPSPTPTPKVSPCPNITIQSQTRRAVRDGQRIGFFANINGGDPQAVPVIVWSTSAGVITQGQSTRRIEVDTTGAGTTPDRELRAEIWVGGYAPQCVLQASATVRIIPPAYHFGEFGEIGSEDLATNLKALADFASQTPRDTIYVIGYAGRDSERGFISNWLTRIRAGLEKAGVSAHRIAAVSGGFREQPLFDFWIVPLGTRPPRPTPTVKPSEIVYPNARRPNKP